MSAPDLRSLALALIAPSPTNPRRREQNAASNLKRWKLDDLAESIRQHGVMQPILVRPNPEHNGADGSAPFELVAGERRWRASMLAGAPTVPALVRELTTGQVLTLQITENIQDEPLHPLEEAEHFERMLATPGGPADAEEVAALIGKSKTLVRNRLALLKLCPEARDACFAGPEGAGISASVALELANAVPDPAQQLAALKELATGWAGDPFSARQAAAYLRKKFMLRLDRARFDPQAKYSSGASMGWYWGPEPKGACNDCPKRTGANPDFFTDVKEGDLCLDAGCFNGKAEAAHRQLLDAARAEGATVISGEPAAKLMRAGATKPFGHQLLDAPCIAFSDHPKPLRELAGDAIASADLVFVDVPGSEAPVVVVSDAVAQRALKAKGLLKIVAPPPAAPKAKPKAKDGGAPMWPANYVPNTKPAAAAPTIDPDPTDPLFEQLLDFDVIHPTRGRPWNDKELKSFTAAAEGRATSLFTAQAVSKHLRTAGEEGLPSGLANILLVTVLWGDAIVTPALATQLLDLDEPPPETPRIDALSDWAMALDAEDAIRLLLLLLTLQDGGPAQTVFARFPAAVATSIGLDANALASTARQHVQERLRLDLVKHAPPAAKKAPRKSAKAAAT